MYLGVPTFKIRDDMMFSFISRFPDVSRDFYTRHIFFNSSTFLSIRKKSKLNSEYSSNSMDLHYMSLTKANANYLLKNLELREWSNKDTWLVLTSKMSIEEIVDDIQSINLDFDDDFIVAQKKIDDIELWELYKIGPLSKIEYINIGRWSEKEGLKITSGVKWHRRSNLKGFHFNFTCLVENPFITKMEKNEKTGRYACCSGNFTCQFWFLKSTQ